jgi:hypothetical protein
MKAKAKTKKKPIAKLKAKRRKMPSSLSRPMAKLAGKVAAGIHRRAARMTPQARAKADAATGKIAGARKKPVARAKPRQVYGTMELDGERIQGKAIEDPRLQTDIPPVPEASPEPEAMTEPTPINAKRKREPGGDSDRGFYLRLGDKHSGPANKKLVEAAAEKLGIAMNKFAAAASMLFVAAGLNPTAVTIRRNPVSDVMEIIPAAPVPEHEAGETEVAQAASA